MKETSSSSSSSSMEEILVSNRDEDLEDLMEFDMDSDDDYDDDDDVSCPPPRLTKTVYLISDSTGSTVKSALQKALVQFDKTDCYGHLLRKHPNQQVSQDCANPSEPSSDEASSSSSYITSRTFTFVRSQEAVALIVQKAARQEAMIIFTMADVDLRQQTRRMCELSHVPAVDLLGPTLETMSHFLQQTPKGLPQFGTARGTAFSNNNKTPVPPPTAPLNDLYYQRIEAVEFTLKADDGQAPWLLPQADIILVGVSRTGKTPLSVVLSHTLGLKVANVPLVVECPVPSQLLVNATTDAPHPNGAVTPGVDPQRVFCLTVAPSELRRIRTTRLERNLGSKALEDTTTTSTEQNQYANRNYILQDLQHARQLAQEQGWTVVDVTGRAVEETASWIGEMMNERFNRQEH